MRTILIWVSETDLVREGILFLQEFYDRILKVIFEKSIENPARDPDREPICDLENEKSIENPVF